MRHGDFVKRHKERYRKLLYREMTLYEALREHDEDWRKVFPLGKDFRSSDPQPSDEHAQREPAEDATGGTAGPGPAPD